MEKAFFSNKTFCSFGITSHVITSDQITKFTGIIPDKSYIKGEISFSKHSGSELIKPHHLWQINSKKIISENEDIVPHIKFLKSKINDKKELFIKLKNNPECEVSITINLETEDAGIGIDLLEEELYFLKEFSNRVTFFFLAIDHIEKE